MLRDSNRKAPKPSLLAYSSVQQSQRRTKDWLLADLNGYERKRLMGWPVSRSATRRHAAGRVRGRPDFAGKEADLGIAG